MKIPLSADMKVGIDQGQNFNANPYIIWEKNKNKV